MRKEDKLITELMIWDMMFDGDLFGKNEPAGCTPYILMAGAILGLFSFILDMIPIFINNFLYILVASLVFTVVLPFINYIRAKSKRISFIDFIYIILSLVNSTLGCVVGFSALYYILFNNFKHIISDQNNIYLLSMFFLGYFFFKITQNLIWNSIILILFKERKILNG
ncbi:MAG: hypothetical protein JJT76_18915 [Clostridiaceae bacterium]|nr:hypothetical protein [Clostridiaceae bacterium]